MVEAINQVAFDTRSSPKLRDIFGALAIRRSYRDPITQEIIPETQWQNLYQHVQPFSSVAEMTDNVRTAVRQYVGERIPAFQEQVPRFAYLSKKRLTNAIVNNWFEEVTEDIGGKRSEINLAVAASISRHIETHTAIKLLDMASPQQLQQMGMTAGLRDLTIQLMQTSLRADPLFIRFLAFSQKGPPAATSDQTVTLTPHAADTVTYSQFFPHETQHLSRHLLEIAAKDDGWAHEPGAQAFQTYLTLLSVFYAEDNPQKAEILHQIVLKQYVEVVRSGFPLLVTPATEGYYKPPYFDPEIKVSFVARDAQTETAYFEKLRDGLADSLDELGVAQFAGAVKQQIIVVADTLAGNGVNLTFDAVAQEKPAAVVGLYRNNQRRAYDRKLPKALEHLENTQSAFAQMNTSERKKRQEFMSRTLTMMHENGHPVFPDDSVETTRLGETAATVIDEVKAEIIYSALIPTLVEKGTLAETKDEWACVSLMGSLMLMKDVDPDDDYFKASAYVLNRVFEQGIVTLTPEKTLRLHDVDAYFTTIKENAQELIAVYQNSTMNPTQARHWIENKCTTGEKLQAALKFLRQKVRV